MNYTGLIACLMYFNSIKVRLELVVELEVLFCVQFQFHKGTIRTGYGTAYYYAVAISIP